VIVHNRVHSTGLHPQPVDNGNKLDESEGNRESRGVKLLAISARMPKPRVPRAYFINNSL